MAIFIHAFFKKELAGCRARVNAYLLLRSIDEQDLIDAIDYGGADMIMAD